MSETKVAAVKKHKSLAKGLIAGLIAGLAATAAKALAERIFPPQPKHPPEPQGPAAERMMGETHTALAKARQSEAFRWGLGAAAGAAYGAVAEFYPEATARHGASFGLALEAIGHEGALPALGLAAAARWTRPRASTAARSHPTSSSASPPSWCADWCAAGSRRLLIISVLPKGSPSAGAERRCFAKGMASAVP